MVDVPTGKHPQESFKHIHYHSGTKLTRVYTSIMEETFHDSYIPSFK